jgi:hypothetical protein
MRLCSVVVDYGQVKATLHETLAVLVALLHRVRRYGDATGAGVFFALPWLAAVATRPLSSPALRWTARFGPGPPSVGRIAGCFAPAIVASWRDGCRLSRIAPSIDFHTGQCSALERAIRNAGD